MLTMHKVLCVTSIAVSLFVGGCATDGASTPRPAVEIHTVTRTVEVPRPCAVKKPDRPGPLLMPLPTDAVALAAVLALKLREYAGPGKYADQADAAIAICTAPAK
jgi:hypothetical protein